MIILINPFFDAAYSHSQCHPAGGTKPGRVAKDGSCAVTDGPESRPCTQVKNFIIHGRSLGGDSSC